MSAKSVSAVPYYFCNPFTLYTLDFNIRNVGLKSNVGLGFYVFNKMLSYRRETALQGAL